MWLESQLVVDRINNRIATEATVFKMAITTAVAAVFSKDGGSSANEAFAELIRGLSGDES
ncbi:hypothetical protein [Mesorhizobium sp. B2-8-9]|uniref:hypothetical protein n=1 Tax=Mesorhizobium sp. B2-8-9 TaxID=2589899 RepID=UPI001129A1A4|nr:hypothetical protein [Mesorhizobium sp. B2-8-9]TPI86363.1 hypothetical protein FJ423_00635 [Mesorhizobium sp. B2-8-9]